MKKNYLMNKKKNKILFFIFVITIIISQLLFTKLKGSVQRSSIKKISVKFSEDVIVDPNSLSITGIIHGPIDLTRTSFYYYVENYIAEWIFPTSLPDDEYIAIWDKNMISDLSGNKLDGNNIFEFYVLFGDTNGDKVVDMLDLYIFVSCWLKPPGDTGLDYDGNNIVNYVDFSFFAKNFMK